MLLNQSPRGSFSVPVNITLQGARRRHMRDVIHHQAQLHDSGGNWRKERELKCNEKARAQIPDSSVGEDRAVLLGFLMMTCSILMYLMVGILMVKPCIHRQTLSPSVSTLPNANETRRNKKPRPVTSNKH
nr:calcium-activated potassium channel subunit beta-3-like isoform X4 [Danio rerio]|eukprot:XP_009295882.1 calcium-activated potassium channel subunit beta-3-like isoform X4 [Danio rerio]